MDRRDQIRSVHAQFINQTVESLRPGAPPGQFDSLMKLAGDSGWTELVARLRQIAAGRRDPELLNGLDEEDGTIVEAILLGLQDPASLPDPNAAPDPAQAAPGLAGMIHAAGSGDHRALQLIADMAEQMSRAGGPMARLAAVIRPLVNGERNADRLCERLDERSAAMVNSILAELKRLERS